MSVCEGEAVWGRVRRSGVCANGRVRVCVCVCVCEGDYVGVGGVECEMSVRWGISPHDQTLSLIFSQLCMCG